MKMLRHRLTNARTEEEMPMTEQCIFCSIVEGKQEAAEVYRSEDVVAFLDINPVNPGHCLVIPARHVETLPELQPGELNNCIQTAQQVGRAVMEATGWPGLNLLQNNHRCAGQLISHAHFHVIPRSPDDGFSLGWRQQDYAEGEMQEMQQKIESAL